MKQHNQLRRSGRRWTAQPWLALVVVGAVGWLSTGCAGDDTNDYPTPKGFAGKGGLFGASGVGTPSGQGGKNGGKGGSGGKGSQPGAAGLPSATCAKGLADTAPVTPTIWLVVDGSSSMTNAFANGRNRWQTLRSTLMDPGGIVETLQDVAKFGLVIYAGSGPDPAQCVQLITVDPALNNHAAISAKYPADPVASGTPTDRALDYVVKELPVANQANPDREAGPIYVVLATDGQPNIGCGDLSGGSDAQVEKNVIDITKRGTENGMNMYVISMAGGDQRLQSHLEQVAAATATKTKPFVPATQNDLIATFQKIVNGASCQIDLKGMVDEGAACSGKVMLNDKDLTCNSDNGWRLIDADTIQLTGKACSDFLSSASSVYAMFPCEVFRPD
ncbi:MAG TPA: vWA domain-containing protein [Polyangiales bacterium]|nr:vWA domain-containing protein [Polyangiales bacterium]